MSFVAAPSLPIKGIQWNLNRPAQINTGAYTGVRQVVATPWFSQWSAHVDLAQTQGEAGFRLIRSFIAKMRGSINTFRLYATLEAQNSNFGVSVASNAAQGATSLSIAGYTTPLTEGQFFTVNGQLCVCTADQSSGTLTFEPPLRAAANAGTPVVTSKPYALVYLANQQQTWSEGNWRLFDYGFDVAEDINGTDGATIPETELVTNGTFTTDTSGWTASGATLSVVGGRMRVTNSGAAAGLAQQSITVIPGKSYTVKWDAVAGTATIPAFVVLDSGNSYVSNTTYAAGQSATFVALSSPITIRCYADDSVSGHYADFDNISLREA